MRGTREVSCSRDRGKMRALNHDGVIKSKIRLSSQSEDLDLTHGSNGRGKSGSEETRKNDSTESMVRLLQIVLMCDSKSLPRSSSGSCVLIHSRSCRSCRRDEADANSARCARGGDQASRLGGCKVYSQEDTKQNEKAEVKIPLKPITEPPARTFLYWLLDIVKAAVH